MSALKREELSETNTNQAVKNYCIDFHGAAVISQDGKEIAITEEMVESACNKLMSEDYITPYLVDNR